MFQSEFFKPGCVAYSPEEVRHIRHSLGESVSKFADRFFLTESAIKCWETPEFNEQGKKNTKYRAVAGPAARCMYWAAVEANNRGSSKNNLIRLGMKMGKK